MAIAGRMLEVALVSAALLACLRPNVASYVSSFALVGAVKEIPSSLPAHKRAVAVEIAGGYLPDARMTRRDDWGWELRSHMLVARSVTHRRQPESREEMRALVGEWHREQARRHQEQQQEAAQ